MSEDGKVVCDSCEYRGIASLAVKFCRSCQEHLCKDCIDLHKSFKLTRGHLLADIGDKHTLLLCSGIENLRMCQLHPNKPLEFYCWVHEQLLCSLCIIKAEQHIKCNKTIVDIESVGKSLTSCHLPEMAKFEFQKSISSARDAVQEMKEIENESTIKTEGLKADIKQLRAKIIKTFDEKTKGIIKKADKISTDIDEKYSKSIEKLENIIKTAETNKSLLESVLESGTPDDVFRCSVRMLELIGRFKLETEKGIEEEYIKQEFDILKSDLLEMLEKFDKPLVQFQVKETKIKRSLIDHKEQPYEVMKNQLISLCSIEDKRDTLQKDNVEQEDVKEIANSLKIETAQTQLEKISNSSDAMEIDKHIHEEHENTATVKKEKEYVEMAEYDISLEHKNAFTISLSDEKETWFGGIICLSNENLVLSDFKHSRLFLLNKKYQIVSTKDLGYEPGQMSLLSEVCISVCLMKTNQILLVNVQQDKFKDDKFIKTKFHPKCVQPVDDKLLVACKNGIDEWNLSLMTTRGGFYREIQLTNFFDGQRIAVQHLKHVDGRFRIIQCCEVTDKLRCLELDGTLVFDKEVSKVSSVVTDTNGYIFVIRYTGEIQVLGRDGELKWKQPLNKAKFAAFNQAMDKLFITSYKTPKIHVLNIKRKVIE